MGKCLHQVVVVSLAEFERQVPCSIISPAEQAGAMCIFIFLDEISLPVMPGAATVLPPLLIELTLPDFAGLLIDTGNGRITFHRRDHGHRQYDEQ